MICLRLHIAEQTYIASNRYMSGFIQTNFYMINIVEDNFKYNDRHEYNFVIWLVYVWLFIFAGRQFIWNEKSQLYIQCELFQSERIRMYT